MIDTVASICTQEYFRVDPLDGVRTIQTLFSQRNVKCCLVWENNHILGLISAKELLTAHPNRIAADVMTTEIPLVNPSTPLWQAQELIDALDVDIALVQEGKAFHGILSRTRLYHELGKHIDLLTGLYKSGYLYYQGSKLVASGQEIAIIFLDVNNFGEIDKTYGHTKGDLILLEVSKLLKNVVPDNVHLSRFGGDEFVILQAAHLPESINLVHSLKQAFSAHPFPFGITLSVSAGVVGGRRRQSRPDNSLLTIKNLINAASLESTKAKQNENNLSVRDAVDIHDIA
ncbi:MAG: GGDEF domain-containing protein [Desulfitobacteriaceae bacterium]